MISSSQRPLPDNTRHSQQTNIHAPGGIRTHDLRRWAAEAYIYDISSLMVNDLTLILLTWRKWWVPNNASKEQMGFNSGFKGLNEVTIFLSHVTHVYYVHIVSSDQKLSFLNIWHCFMIGAIVLWYQFRYQSQILLKIILITLCCWRTFCILFCEMCTYWVVLLSVDVIKFVFYIDIARAIHLMCAAISSRASFMHYNWL